MLPRLRVFSLPLFISKRVDANHVSSINRLPVDLLVSIFYLSEEQNPKRHRYPYLRLSWVCRYWRQIINGYGGFWGVVHFSPWKGKNFIKELVSRSGPTRLLSVFSPLGYDLGIRRLFRRRGIISAFGDLLQTQAHRIGLLCLEDDPSGYISEVLLGKNFPVIHTFICQFVPRNETLAIIGSAQGLQNLQIVISANSSLSELKPSFERLRHLNIVLPSLSNPCTREFVTDIPLCFNLESLVVHIQTSNDPETEAFHPHTRTTVFPKLTLLEVSSDCHALSMQIRAPALRSLEMAMKKQQHYLLFDDYDLSSITHLSVRGINAGIGRDATVYIKGSVGRPLPHHRPSLIWNLDLSDSLSSSLYPVQFDIHASTLYRSGTGSNSAFFRKVLPKLHSIDTLSLAPFDLAFHSRQAMLVSDFQFLHVFLDEILSNLSPKSQLRSITFSELQLHSYLLLILFAYINSDSYLSHLDEIHLLSWSLPKDKTNTNKSFGETLINSLRQRQKAGLKPLQIVSITGRKGVSGLKLSKKCIEEAATLGTLILQK